MNLNWISFLYCEGSLGANIDLIGVCFDEYVLASLSILASFDTLGILHPPFGEKGDLNMILKKEELPDDSIASVKETLAFGVLPDLELFD